MGFVILIILLMLVPVTRNLVLAAIENASEGWFSGFIAIIIVFLLFRWFVNWVFEKPDN